MRGTVNHTERMLYLEAMILKIQAKAQIAYTASWDVRYQEIVRITEESMAAVVPDLNAPFPP